MIIVRAARLDRRGVGAADIAADRGRAHPMGADSVILGTHPNINPPVRRLGTASP
jgi:hypothetical protein